MIIAKYIKELDNNARRNYYIQGFIEGFIEGFVKGVKQGQFAMVKSLLQVKTPIEYIIAATGWTEEEILKLVDKEQGVGEHVGIGIRP